LATARLARFVEARAAFADAALEDIACGIAHHTRLLDGGAEKCAEGAP
jgi:hypothetical protein